MNKIETEKKRREQIIARDPIVQKKLQTLKELQDKQKEHAKSSTN